MILWVVIIVVGLALVMQAKSCSLSCTGANGGQGVSGTASAPVAAALSAGIMPNPNCQLRPGAHCRMPSGLSGTCRSDGVPECVPGGPVPTE